MISPEKSRREFSVLWIIPLVFVVAILGYYTTMFYGDMRASRIETSFIKGVNEDLKNNNETLRDQYPEFQQKVAAQYEEYIAYLQSGIQYYEGLFSTGYLIKEDGEVYLRANTFIIPPPEDEAEENQEIE